MDNSFGKALEKWRGERSQRWLADKLGKSPATISQWESGNMAPPRKDVCRQLAEALEVPFEHVWEEAARERIGRKEGGQELLHWHDDEVDAAVARASSLRLTSDELAMVKAVRAVGDWQVPALVAAIVEETNFEALSHLASLKVSIRVAVVAYKQALEEDRRTFVFGARAFLYRQAAKSSEHAKEVLKAVEGLVSDEQRAAIESRVHGDWRLPLGREECEDRGRRFGKLSAKANQRRSEHLREARHYVLLARQTLDLVFSGFYGPARHPNAQRDQQALEVAALNIPDDIDSILPFQDSLVDDENRLYSWDTRTPAHLRGPLPRIEDVLDEDAALLEAEEARDRALDAEERARAVADGIPD
jgi:transcriptional regulator with XRE-family HTH domain